MEYKTKCDRPHDDAMAEMLREDPALAAEMLCAILADGDQGEWLIALRQLNQAFGGVPKVAQAAKVDPT